MTHHVYLTGYRGCGKSTVARMLAARLHRPAIDLDDVIEQTAGQSIAEIFETETERGFRDRESAALAEVASRDPAIVALGGGTILRSENRALIAASGHCVWLDGSAELLAARIAGDASTATRRPSLTGRSGLDEVQSMLESRRAFYAEAARWRIELLDQSPFELVNQIVAMLEQDV